MSESKSNIEPSRPSTREKVLAAAERLLGGRSADFSMRDLAAAAGVSFATPFNQFGSKLAIMRALSAERIERMHARCATDPLSTDTSERVFDVMTIAVAVMTERPDVNKAVMAAIGAPGAEPGDIRERSLTLWTEALGDASGLSLPNRDLGIAILPDQLALIFRGVLSFWTAGEICDDALLSEALAAAAAALFGFVDDARQEQLVALMRAAPRSGCRPRRMARTTAEMAK